MEEKTFTHCRSSWRPCFQDNWLLSDPEDSFSLASSGEEEDTNQQRVQLWCDLQARWECSSLATSGQLHGFAAWLLSAGTQRLRVNGQEDRFPLNCRSKQQQLSPRLWLHQWLSAEICLIPVGWGLCIIHSHHSRYFWRWANKTLIISWSILTSRRPLAFCRSKESDGACLRSQHPEQTPLFTAVDCSDSTREASRRPC